MVSAPITRLVSSPPDYVQVITTPANTSTANGSFICPPPPGVHYVLGGRCLNQELYMLAIATSLSLLIGCVQFGAGLVQLGFLTAYLSEPMVNGFTTGAAIHVATSQLVYVFGFNVTTEVGAFRIIKACF